MIAVVWSHNHLAGWAYARLIQLTAYPVPSQVYIVTITHDAHMYTHNVMEVLLCTVWWLHLVQWSRGREVFSIQLYDEKSKDILWTFSEAGNVYISAMSCEVRPWKFSNREQPQSQLSLSKVSGLKLNIVL